MRISDWSSDVCSSDLPVRGRLGRGPGLAGQAVAAGAARDRRGIGGAAPVEQVVARARHVADHLDRTLTGAARVAAADPWHAVVSFVGLGLLDGGDGKIGRASWRERGCQYV